ncbi:ATP-binding cassette domain-containing protein [Nguyenibacter vanlangensis]|uniref:ATP-binding cassette domain-containing protein n=1 Tax=Nguyenibacter vanlangensis TaxID=1216886 RepID=A0A7Y7M5D8_9PROT|nr:ATP-binding cassette domain-containing protein [Nguyenibacter vanlangensis]NVN09774.1 ATP-binding cassette domain-containing protein [Nguyenibacter vanlangensis]
MDTTFVQDLGERPSRVPWRRRSFPRSAARKVILPPAETHRTVHNDTAIDIKTMSLKRATFKMSVNEVKVGSGRCLAIVGPNGSGKTSLMESLLGLTEASATLSIMGQPVTLAARSTSARRDIGVQLLSAGYPCMLRVRDLVATHALLYGKAAPQVHELLDIGALADKTFGVLSQGERQRFKLYMAWAHRPRLVFMDEPFTGLDQMFASAVERLISERGSTTVMMICHSSGELALADEMIWMTDGIVRDHGPVTDMKDRLLGSHRISIRCVDKAMVDFVTASLNASGELRHITAPDGPGLVVAYGGEQLVALMTAVMRDHEITEVAIAQLGLGNLLTFCAAGGEYV